LLATQAGAAWKMHLIVIHSFECYMRLSEISKMESRPHDRLCGAR
jgi:hypothetical protein